MAGPADGDDGEHENAHIISMLVATDNHLGYLEKDPIRGHDSINTFAEILQIARDRQVDFVLLGGDLFHDNKPSRWTMFKTMELLRQYCMGDKPCEFDFLSDQAVNFTNSFGTVNYQDPNFNIAIPVFSIHGNHDDPSGEQNLAALDLLSITGLVNYFGKSSTADDISVQPLLMRKGDTKLALYGLGNVRDERLYRTIVKGKMQFMRPEAFAEEWFNLFVIHQNRVRHTATSYIPETFIDPFIHFIIWGHEHECVKEPQTNSQQNFEVVQPGSSVATSLSEGEARPKHVGILRIKGHEYHWEAIPLKTVRPFVMGEVVLKESGLRPGQTSTEEDMLVLLTEKVNEMIEQAKEEWRDLHAGSKEKLPDFPQPLIRLKVEYSGGFTTYPPQRFGSRFVNKVANAREILQFYRKKTTHDPTRERRKAGTAEPIQLPDLPAAIDDKRVEDLVGEYLAAQQLDILPENELGDAVKVFVEKDDKDAIKDFVKESLDKIQKDLKATHLDDDDDEDVIRNQATDIKNKRVEEYDRLKPGAKRSGQDRPAKSKKRRSSSMDEDEEEEEEEESDSSLKKTKSKAKAAPKKAAAPAKKATTSRSKKKKESSEEEDDDDLMNEPDDLEEEEPPKKATKAAPSRRKAKSPSPPPARSRAKEPEPSATNKRKLPGTLVNGGSQPKKRATATSSSAGKKQTVLQFSQKPAPSQSQAQKSEAIVLDDD